MFLKTTEYALRAVVYLAASSERSATNQQISEAIDVSVGYLSKVLQSLGRKGIVHSQRGPSGGFTLVKPPDELTLLDIITAVQPIRRVQACPLDDSDHAESLCALHRRLDEAASLLEDWFGRTTVASLIEEMYHDPLHPESRCAFLGPHTPAMTPVNVSADGLHADTH